MFSHIHEALQEVREIRRRVWENQLFRGYSGPARALGGLAALVGALVMSRSYYPLTVSAHVVGWGAVCAVAMTLNYGAVLSWYVHQDQGARQLNQLRPLLDTLPAMFVGAVLTLALLMRSKSDLLFGTWMCLFGLVNASSRHSQPWAIWQLGWFYIVAGAVLLLFRPSLSFFNPWPMALVFFVGECAGGLVFHLNRKTENVIRSN